MFEGRLSAFSTYFSACFFPLESTPSDVGSVYCHTPNNLRIGHQKGFCCEIRKHSSCQLYYVEFSHSSSFFNFLHFVLMVNDILHCVYFWGQSMENKCGRWGASDTWHQQWCRVGYAAWSHDGFDATRLAKVWTNDVQDLGGNQTARMFLLLSVFQLHY